MSETTAPLSAPHPAHRPVAIWLFIMAVLIAIMVTVGGATRLTDSGLSITEWDLIMGTLPPLSEAAWIELFELYKQIPEYEQVNYGMTLAQFEEIFWWEWGHRNLGRLIGLAFLIPLVWWSFKGRVRGGLRWRLWGLFALIGLQGAIGWFMVASGLSGRVDVSQYRLALHLGTAIILFGLILWQALALIRTPGKAAAGPGLSGFAQFMVLAIFAQIILGAFVAGLRAGMTYNTWPLMLGQVFPAGYWNTPAAFKDMFETIEAVQFNHRTFAYLLMILGAGFMTIAWRKSRKAGGYAIAVFGALFLQMLLGIWTIVAAVPLPLGLAHQLGALVVLSAAILAAFEMFEKDAATPAA